MDCRLLIFDFRLGKLGHTPLRFALRQRRRGAALIIVLASLVFLAALTLAFLASVNTELRSSKVYSAGTNSKLLAQIAVNLATAQITEAARGVDAGGNTLAWASQPGMIRTYNTSGQPAGYYKLYSWTEMTGTGAFDHTLATNTVPINWSSQKAIFTDLNKPIRSTSGSATNTVYPIIDGNNLTTMTAVGGNKTYGSNNIPAIDGFYVSTNAPVNGATNANPVPMPVKWLYVLEDGKVVAPGPGARGNLAVVAGASTTNQIVGRVAFWADDETCKVNINTASEGSYADHPRFNSTYDTTTLSKNQPGQNEFQRYPGHPATTSLSTILKKPASGYTDQEWAEELYNIFPRVVGGGSQGGTAATTQASLMPVALSPDSDRLYASVDELLFKPTLDAQTRPNRNPNDPTTATVLNREKLEQAKFFLTAGSRSPDLNLFNKPRVGLWPVHLLEDSNHRTPFDRVIAFCSTINGKAYHFLRQDAGSATADLPSAGDTAGLGRNRMLISYLQSLTAQNIPGFGGSFLTKYPSPGTGQPSERDQILTQVFDYIRSTNLLDAAKKDNPTYVQYAPVSPTATSPSNSGSGEVVPIEDTNSNTRGFGRFPTVAKAFLVFIGNADSTIASASPPVPANKIRVQAGFFLDMFDPSQGMVPGYPRFHIRVTGLNALSWGESDTTRTPMTFPGTATLGTPISYAFGPENFVGGIVGWSVLAYGKGWNTASKYPFLTSTGIDLPATTGSSFSFGGGVVTVEILSADTGVVLQTLRLNFPSTTSTTQFPVPQLAPASLPNTNGQNFRVFAGSSGGRLNSSSSAGNATYSGESFLVEQDVVRSIQCIHGDARLIAAKKTVEPADNLFAPHPNYTNPAKRMAHSLRTSLGLPYHGATGGRLAGVPYLGYATEYTSNGRAAGNYAMNLNYVKDFGNPSASGVAVGKTAPFAAGDTPGDWDNGFGNQPDGPYINKVDEGDIGSATQLPYYGDLRYTRIANALFSPNRQVPSAGVLGSLPSGVISGRPWQTLLFRPGPPGHPGLASPRDHLLLDLFHMPVVEPYVISEPLSTAGRVNMNYQLVPFSYINRDTGIRAVLKSEKVIAVPDASVNPGGAQRGYKYYEGMYSPASFRMDIDPDQTLQGFQQRFSAKDIFRSASEICDLEIVPAGATYAGMSTYWNTRRATGDNSRERAYATIYPRLTTKSNTFTIHYSAQSLQKVTGGDPAIWDETRDKITGEFRGSQTIERFIDPNDTTLPDYADSAVTTPISDFYKTRVLQAKQFAP